MDLILVCVVTELGFHVPFSPEISETMWKGVPPPPKRISDESISLYASNIMDVLDYLMTCKFG
jgi:hypothetical protein